MMSMLFVYYTILVLFIFDSFKGELSNQVFCVEL